MVSPVSTEVVIECPHCGTRYHLPSETLGARGRAVSCAHCGGTWRAKPIAPDDAETMFDADAEAELDAAFTEEERRQRPDVSGSNAKPLDGEAAGPPQPATNGGRPRAIGDVQRKFLVRQAALRRSLPLAKAKRLIRVVALCALFALIAGGIVFRTQVVRAFPDLAGAYQALGLGVNVVGLEFRDVRTLVSLRDGAPVLRVDGEIQNVTARQVVVPPVRVTLLDGAGDALYEWSTVTEVRELLSGEVLEFTTQLVSPPAIAARVRLTFTDGRISVDAPIESAATTSE